MKLSKFLSLLFFLFFSYSLSHAAPFDKDVPYQDAVPAFLQEITSATAAVKDTDELNAISQWESDARARLPEFLDDLLTIAQQLEAQGTPEFIFEEYAAFAQKWNQIALDYPGLNELDPVLSPIIDQLFAGLPTLQPPSSDNPLSGLADLYKALEIEDPWGLGGFFVLEPLADSHKEINITEVLNEKRVEGVKSKEIISRETVATLNGIVVYFELINNGQIVQRFVNFRDPSIIHETLQQMIINNEDPAVIAALEDLVALIDINLAQALDAGVLDECSYAFIYRKINAGALEHCTDVINAQQDFVALTRFDPFDDVNQVQLSEPQELVGPLEHAGQLGDVTSMPTLQKPSVNEILADYQQGFLGTTQTFMMGFVIPAYLLTLLGFFRGL